MGIYIIIKKKNLYERIFKVLHSNKQQLSSFFKVDYYKKKQDISNLYSIETFCVLHYACIKESFQRYD